MAEHTKNSQVFSILGLCLCLAVLNLSCHKPVPTQPKPSAETVSAYTDILIYTSSGTLYTTDLTGNTVEKLSGSSGGDWFPTVSPDFTQLAFWSTASGSHELWRMDLASQRRTQLTFFNEPRVSADMQNFIVHNAPTWSPDGKRLAFAYAGKIWVMESTGFNLETIVPEGESVSPAWSPDGNLLAYVVTKNKTANLYLHKLATAETWALTNFPVSQRVGAPAWSPNGAKIAFTVSTREDADLWVIQADGSHLTRITQDKRSHSPVWSPDGKRLAFASGRQDPFHWEIWVMHTDGTGAFSVSRNGGAAPSWMHVLTDHDAPTAGTTTARPPAVSAPVEPTPNPVTTRPLQPVEKTLPIAPAPQPTTPPVEVAYVPPTSVPTRVPTELPAPPTAAPSPEAVKKIAAAPTPVPETKPDKEENYAEYEKYAEADKSILPDLDVKEDKTKNRLIYLPKVEFYFAKDLIKPVSLPILSRLAEEMGKHPESPLIVQGQPSGPALLRMFLGKSLSRARANSVLRHLIVTEKIKQINVNAIGEGDEFPDLGKREDNQPVLLIIIK